MQVERSLKSLSKGLDLLFKLLILFLNLFVVLIRAYRILCSTRFAFSFFLLFFLFFLIGLSSLCIVVVSVYVLNDLIDRHVFTKIYRSSFDFWFLWLKFFFALNIFLVAFVIIFSHFILQLLGLQ